ncbi:MAG: OprD family porin, partial [Bacteroidetes bacterium]|nr:OprD family porin [Bacteroidota bacterium]
MKYLFLLFCSFVLMPLSTVRGQVPSDPSVPEKDTTSLKGFLKRGSLTGLARTYFAATLNQKELADSYAWAAGAGVGYQTPVFLRRFQAGISGFFILKLASSDLAIPEPTTGQLNRYELGLFDIDNPGNSRNLNRLEELFLKVHFGKKSLLTVGRQIPQTPFINPQDGRMRPTLTEAAVLDWKENKYLALHAEYIWRMSPRSTVHWYDVGDTFGLYPAGVDLSGKPAQYRQQVHTKGIGIVGLTYQKKQWNVQVWDTYVDNVLNTLLLKTEWKSNPV